MWNEHDSPKAAGARTGRTTSRTRPVIAKIIAKAPSKQTNAVEDRSDMPRVENDRTIDPSLLLELFGQTPIVFNRIYIDITGSVSAALWLAYAIYHVSERCQAPTDWWHKSQQEWQLETGLSRREQESARQRLRILGVLGEQRSPNAPLAYRIAMERLYALLETHSRNLHAEMLAARSTPEQ